MSELQENFRSYIRHVLGMLEISASGLAKKSGVSASTITRFLNSPDHKFTVSSTTIAKIAESSGISPVPFLDGGRNPSERAEFQTVEDNFAADAVTLVEYEVNPGAWIDIKRHTSSRLEMGFWIPPLRMNGVQFYALVKGRSIDAFAKDGEYLFCMRAEPDWTFETMSTNDLAIIETSTDDRRLVEVSAMRVRIGLDGAYLDYPSTDPRYDNTTVRVDGEHAGANRIRILGYAMAAVRTILKSPQR